MLIQSIRESFQRGVETVGNRFTLAPLPQIVKNVNRVAIPAIALAAFSSFSEADAGPWSYGICLVSCVGLAEAPPLFAICIAACNILLQAPLP